MSSGHMPPARLSLTCLTVRDCRCLTCCWTRERRSLPLQSEAQGMSDETGQRCQTSVSGRGMYIKARASCLQLVIVDATTRQRPWSAVGMGSFGCSRTAPSEASFPKQSIREFSWGFLLKPRQTCRRCPVRIPTLQTQNLPVRSWAMFMSSNTRWPRRRVRGPRLLLRVAIKWRRVVTTQSAPQGQLDEFSRKAV